MSLGETTLLTKELLSDAAVTVADVIGKLGSDDDHVAVCSAATDGMIGIIQQTATAAEQTMRLVLEGIADVKYGGTVTRGDRLTSDASGYAITAVAGQNSIGVATKSGVSGDIGSCLVSPQTLPSAAGVDGHSYLHVAMATYDFAVDGGAISAIDLGVDIPDNAIIVDSLVDVITTLTSATDAATIAIHTQSADDIVAAVAISAATDWDAGLHAGIPVGTAATAIKMTAARAITATIAVEAVTAGKFIVFIYYIMSV